MTVERTMRKYETSKPGFTLVELLVVISIVALLAAIIVPVFSTMGQRQRQSACMNNLREIGVALAQYREDYGHYPPAPRPDYLDARGTEYEAMPFAPWTGVGESERVEPFPEGGLDDLATGGTYAQSSAVTYSVWISGKGTPDLFNWTDGTSSGSAINITGGAQLLSYGVTVTFSNTTGHQGAEAWTFQAGETLIPTDPEWQEWELNGNQYEYGKFNAFTADEKRAHLKSGNYGLATLYQTYLEDERDYVRSRAVFHCPAMRDTEGVDPGANVSAIARRERNFDPLWAGYNTYDVTYNYDQYYNAVLDFDAAIGSPGVNRKRQLRNPNPPADTVVTWCYAHRKEPTPYYATPYRDDADPDNPQYSPDVTFDASLDEPERKVELLEKVRQMEAGRKSQVDLVLWVDGSVSAMRPRLMRADTDTDGKPSYYWVPPFLYSPGEWRE